MDYVIKPTTHDFDALLGYLQPLLAENYMLDINNASQLNSCIDYTTAFKAKLTEMESMYYIMLSKIKRDLQNRKITVIKKPLK